MNTDWQLERKFCRFEGELAVTDDSVIEGYASLFGSRDRGGDIVEKGAYARSLARLAAEGRQVKMLWQHDPAQPIGVWNEVREDDKGLFVRGQLLESVARAREAAALIAAGAIDGLSIGYRTIRAVKNGEGRRLLRELELWEVSLVTFPMLPSARVRAKGDPLADDALRELAAALRDARRELVRL
ncbi:HK97 family phage prohead protease [Roseovarius amoyensis]|uniref:HK97 family phage prohead protease n=1 Tax=Roseovarius amoyensis TaxID=2211448 RepID=UPI000DBE921A|nr:HK97 family phage prohead protease [Roseovarius amoyensis]